MTLAKLAFSPTLPRFKMTFYKYDKVVIVRPPIRKLEAWRGIKGFVTLWRTTQPEILLKPLWGSKGFHFDTIYILSEDQN